MHVLYPKTCKEKIVNCIHKITKFFSNCSNLNKQKTAELANEQVKTSSLNTCHLQHALTIKTALGAKENEMNITPDCSYAKRKLNQVKLHQKVTEFRRWFTHAYSFSRTKIT